MLTRISQSIVGSNARKLFVVFDCLVPESMRLLGVRRATLGVGRPPVKVSMGLGANVALRASPTLPFQIDPVQVLGDGVTWLTVCPARISLMVRPILGIDLRRDLKSIQKPSRAEFSAHDDGQTLRDRLRRAVSLPRATRHP